MEVVINKGGPCLILSVKARLLLYDYGYRDHAKSVSDAIKNAMSIYGECGVIFYYKKIWREYISSIRVLDNDRLITAFSKDEEYMMFPRDICKLNRHHPTLIRVIKELGPEAKGVIVDNFVIETVLDNIPWKVNDIGCESIVYKEGGRWR